MFYIDLVNHDICKSYINITKFILIYINNIQYLNNKNNINNMSSWFMQNGNSNIHCNRSDSLNVKPCLLVTLLERMQYICVSHAFGTSAESNIITYKTQFITRYLNNTTLPPMTNKIISLKTRSRTYF